MTQTGLGDFSQPSEATDEGGGGGDPVDEATIAEAVAGNGGPQVTEVLDDGRLGVPDADGTLDLMVTQVDYTIEGQGREEYPVVHVFGRTADNTPEHVRVLGFEPYFYAPTASLDDAMLDRDAITRTEEGYESIRGDALTKIYTRTPRDVGQIRDDFEHYEADILFPNRLLIDKDVGSGIRVPERRLASGSIQIPHDEIEARDVDADLRVNTFDIEVDDRNGFPEEGEEPIVCLTSHDSYDDVYRVWHTVAPDGDGRGVESVSGYEPLRAETDIDVRSFDDEAAMLDAFLSHLETTDPDVLTGWNFEDFDAPYLLDRLDRLNPRTEYDLAVERLSRVDEVWRGGWGGPDVKGRVIFDLLYAYKRTQFTELESYRLDAVGELELGVGKERYSGDIGDLWEREPERLLEYNVRDVELCVEIDRKQEVIAFWDEVRSFVGCKLEDAPTPGDTVDIYVLHKVHGEFALPSKGTVESEEYEGGAVFDPISGVKENVTVLDLKCFSGDTDVLTPDGPRNVRELEVGDRIYTLNPDTLGCEIKPVAETHAYENSFGELHHLSGNTHDLKVTENHRFLASKTRGWDDLGPADFEFTEYRDLVDTERYAFPTHEPMSGRSPETFDLADEASGGHVVVYCENDLRRFRSRVPEAVRERLDLAHGTSEAAGLQQKVGKYLIPLETYREHRDAVEKHADSVFLKFDRGHRETPTSFEMADWLELLGWYVTEGSTDHAAGRFTIHQEDDEGRHDIRTLLDRMGVNYNVEDRGVNVSNRYLLQWLTEHCGEGYANKRLPDWVFDLDGELLRVLLDTLIRGDGSTVDSGLQKFWTKSDDLKDAVVDIAVRCGEKPTVSKQSDGTWYVSVGKRGSFQKSTNATVEPHDGNVYCVTAADNHVVLAGRNGRFQWVGQSLYPMCMVTINASPETKVDPDTYGGPTFHAPNGTHFRTEPDGIIRAMVDELLDEREQKKALRNDHPPDSEAYEQFDRQQAAVKVIMNSLYGVLGWDRFRLYDKEMGAAITATGREVIQFTEEVASGLNYTVAYGDSVTGDRPVVVRDPGDTVRILPIQEVFARGEPVSDRSLLVTADGGPVASAELGKERRTVKGWDALSVNSEGEAEWQPITQAVRHETDEPVVTLQHKFGESTTTRDHSFVVERDEGLVERPPDDIETPLRVPDVPDVTERTTVDVYEVLRGYEREYLDGRSVGTDDATEKIKLVHANEEWVWFGHKHHIYQSKTVRVKRHIDLESDDGRSLIRLLAAYTSEGSASTIETTVSRFGASIAESRRDWLEQLRTDYHRLFDNATASIVVSDNRTERSIEYVTESGQKSVTYDDETLKLQMMNELAAVFFREFAGQTSRGKRIPSFVYHLSNELQELFLDVLVEGDGSRSFPRYTEEYAERHFDFETTSRELAAGLSMLLTQRGRKHSLKYRDAKESYTIRTCDYYRDGRDPVVTESEHDGYVYDLSVERNENFVDAVGGIVLHNTDSVMLELGPDVSKAEAIEQSLDLEEKINAAYDDFARDELGAEEHRFQIEFEKLYRRFFQAGKKKRYAGHIVWKEGKDVDDIDITGFEYKRSDIAAVTKEVQREVIEKIVTGESTESIKTYLHDIIADFSDGHLSLDDVGVPGGIGKRLTAYETATAHVRGARYANLLLGTNFSRGSKPKHLYLEKVHPDFWQRIESEHPEIADDPLYLEFKRDPDVICFEYADQVPEEFVVDWDKMLDKTLKGPISRVIEALGMSWDEVKSGQQQTSFGQFT